MEDLVQALIAAATIILPVIAGLVAVWGRKYLQQLEEKLKLEIGEKNWATIKQFAELFIRAAEQLFNLEEEEKKKQWVIDRLVDVAEGLNLTITRDQIEALVEAVFNEIKDDLKAKRAST